VAYQCAVDQLKDDEHVDNNQDESGENDLVLA
jgi:hypothetical protein